MGDSSLPDEIIRNKLVNYEVVANQILATDVVSDEKVPVDMRVLVVELGLMTDNVAQLQEQLQKAYIKIKEMKEKLDRCTIVEKKDLA